MKIAEITYSGKGHYDGWLTQRFGRDNYAQLSTDYSLKLRLAVQDVSRMLRHDVPYEIMQLTSRMQIAPQGVTDHDFIMGYNSDEGWIEGSIKTDEALKEYVRRYPADAKIVFAALGLPRQKSRHPCAYIIADDPIRDFIPMTSVGGVEVTSFTAKSVEAVGGIKYDFLGVTTLTDIQNAVRLIQERHPDIEFVHPEYPKHYLVPDKDGNVVDIEHLPEDLDVFDDICRGETDTMFQVNTDGAKKWLKYTNYAHPSGRGKLINSMVELAAFNALNRKGPIDYLVQHPAEPDEKHNILVEYYRRLRGQPHSQSIPPIIAKLAPDTQGLIIYQETIQLVYQTVTGCSASEAEEFRRDIGKKNDAKIKALYKYFMEHATQYFGNDHEAQEVWDSLKTFSQYGFNKSHAHGYAVTIYMCAWLKHHYPLEWWCSVLRNADKDKINSKFWTHCGHLISLPDIAESAPHFEIQGTKIRAPISLLYGIGEKAHEQLCQFAPYSSLEDLATKIFEFRKAHAKQVRKTKKHPKTKELVEVDVLELGRSSINRSIIYNLAVSGALDSLVPNTSIGRVMSQWDEITHKVTGKKPAKSKKIYQDLDPVGRYMVKKSILPAYGQDLRPMVVNELPPQLMVVGKNMRFHSKQTFKSGRTMEFDDPVVGIKRFLEIEHSDRLPEYGWRCGLIAYIEDKREFTFHGNKEACSFTIEVGGSKLEPVWWPPKGGTNKLSQSVKDAKIGSIVALLLNKYDTAHAFAIKELVEIRGPLTNEKDSAED